MFENSGGGAPGWRYYLRFKLGYCTTGTLFLGSDGSDGCSYLRHTLNRGHRAIISMTAAIK
jgi:hypothetical protein